MASLTTTLREAAEQNRQLLSTLTQTEYAAPATKQNLQYIQDLKSQIEQTNKELARLHRKTEKERQEHVDYRDSIAKRYMYKLSGKKEKFASRQEKEEKEFLEAWQKEHETTQSREELTKALETAETEQRRIEADAAKHEKAQRELDNLYETIFGGPTPEVPGEDQMQQAVEQARSWFDQCQMQLGNEKRALNELVQAQKFLVLAAQNMNSAISASTMDIWGGGGRFADMMERDALAQAQGAVMQCLRHMAEAQRVQPAIRDLSPINIDNRHIISDIFFDNIFSDIAQHDRIKASNQQVNRAVQQLGAQVNEQGQRVQGAQSQVNDASNQLKSAREELQKIRAEAFERLGSGEQPPAYYELHSPSNEGRTIVPTERKQSPIQRNKRLISRFLRNPASTRRMPLSNNNDSGVSSGVKFVTSTVGNTLGGVTNLVGGVVGAAGRGTGEIIEGATGSAGRPVARGLADAANGVEDGSARIAKGVKNAGEGK